MVNVIAPKNMLVVEADALHKALGNRRLEVKLAKIQKSLTTGVSGVSEFVEINDTTWEVLITLT